MPYGVGPIGALERQMSPERTPTETIDPRQLVTLNLKYGGTASPLRTLAFAQLTAKVLYLIGKPATLTEVARETARILQVVRVSERSIESGLRYLQDNGKGTSDGGQWYLTRDAKQQIEQALRQATDLLGGLLGRHFPADLEHKTARDWFCEASAAVFGHYGDEWVANVSRGSTATPPPLQSVAALLRPITTKYGFESRADTMADGYLAFLASQDPEDQLVLMGVGQAMFSARLVTADVGVDPLALHDLRGALFILDTNVLFALALEYGRLATSLQALGRAFQQISVKPVYIRPSRDEYLLALGYKKAEVLKAVRNYNEDVLSEARDDFLATARARGCRTEEDYARFFDSLLSLPKDLQPGPAILLHEDEKLAKAIADAASDGALQRLLGEESERLRHRKKSPRSLSHDASLIHCAEFERNAGQQCWILTLDRSLAAYGLQRAGPHGLPIVLSADALIEIFALHAAGPELEATEFAPLLARIILGHCEPPANTYTVDDLHWLSTINEAAATLPSNEIKELLRIVARARVSGKSIDDPSLQLEINRRFQQKRRVDEDAFRELERRARGAEDRAEQERIGREAAEHRLARRERREVALAELRRALLWRVPVAIAVCIGLFYLGRWIVGPSGDSRALVSFGLSVIGLAGSGWVLVWRAVGRYRRALSD